MHKAFFKTCVIPCEKLSTEDIENYKLSLIKNKDNTSEEDTSKNDKICKDDTISTNENKCKDKTTSKSDKTPKEDKISKDDKMFKEIKTSKDKNSSTDDEPAKKKQKMNTNRIDVLKLVLSREGETDKFKSQFKSSLKPNKEIVSARIEDVPMEIDCDASTESANSSAISVRQRIFVIDPRKMMNDDKYLLYVNVFADNLFKHQTNGMKKSAIPVKLSTNGPKPSQSTKINGVKLPLNNKNNVKGNLIEIEKLYKKYFSKSVQDTIVTIANILNIISMSNKHHKARMDESFKKRSEAEKLKERCDANRLHARHKKILETKLKNNFINVVSSFAESEFESAFQMFFLSILTVLRVLDQPKFRKGSIFKNLVLLLWNSLKNSEYNHPKIFSMFRSKAFRPDCIDLISLIEDSRDSDPGVTDRMTLFFVSTVNSREYFQTVIDAVTSDSNEDLSLLIDNAAFQCCVNSKFKDPIDSTTEQHSNDKIPAPEAIQNPINSNETIQHWILAKNPDGTYQQIPVLNGNKSQTIGNTAVEPSTVTSQPLNNFYESFSSSLQKKTSESSTPKVMSTKKCIVVTSTISNSPLVQVTASSSGTATTIPTFVTFKPSQINKSMANSALIRAEGNTIVLGNKQFQLLKGSASQMRAVVNGTSILLKSPTSSIIKCYARSCNSAATIMCSSCTMVKYCSHNCQRRDWYDGHINECERLLNIRQTRP